MNGQHSRRVNFRDEEPCSMNVREVWAFTRHPIKLKIPLYTSGVSAGFPSPAEDSLDCRLDLNRWLIDHPAATFCVRVEGDSMTRAHIHDGDVLVVDRMLEADDADMLTHNPESIPHHKKSLPTRAFRA